MDRDGGKLVLRGIKSQYPTIKHIWQDSAYHCQNFNEYTKERGWTSQTIKRSRSRFRLVNEKLVEIDRRQFESLPKRWIVERTFGWFSRYRRLSKDYELCPNTSENMIYLAMIRNMLRRLTNNCTCF